MNAKWPDYIFLALAILCGGGSLILFMSGGALFAVRMLWPVPVALLWDALLSFAFFLQHSGMVRRGFHSRLAHVLPVRYHGAFYAIASGLVLAIVAVFWQPSDIHLFVLSGPAAWVALTCLILALAGFAWGALSLRSFDMLGLGPIQSHLNGKPIQPASFTVRGPYRWVRHPLYFFILVILWSRPDVTADLLLFNVLWTLWIVVGTKLEEGDLIAEFGDAYRDYRRKVPMLLPWRGPISNTG